MSWRDILKQFLPAQLADDIPNAPSPPAIPFSGPIGLGIAAVLIIGLGAVFLTQIQALLYTLLAENPSVIQWTVVILAIYALGRRVGISVPFSSVVIGILLMGLFVGPFIGSLYAQTHTANQVQQDADRLDTLPNTSTENVRVIPRSVADNYAQSSMQQPQYQLTTSDIAYHNGSYVWSYSIVPEPLVVKLTGQQYGAMYVDMTTTEKRIQKEESRFVNGRGLALFDSYRYQSVLESPGKEHRWQTTFNARSNGQPYMAHSTITYDWHFRPFPIPQVFATPRMGSVELMYPNGSTESLSPAQARNTSLLEGQNYYPYHLSNYKIESMQFRQGIINKFFVGDEVLAIADLPEGDNQWPLAVPTETNSPELTYFTATEPTGAGNGVYEIWTTDAQTGEMGVQQYNDSQIGPQRAVDFIERTPQVNRLSNAQAVSPVPIVQGESLYWHAKVIPGSESGVVYTAFVNAASGEVTLLEGTQPIYAFLTQGQVQEVQRQAQQTNQNTMTVRIAVTNQAGEIQGTRNITVPEGGSVEITAENPAGNASSTRASGPA